MLVGPEYAIRDNKSYNRRVEANFPALSVRNGPIAKVPVGSGMTECRFLSMKFHH
jgi:hypothetical protein